MKNLVIKGHTTRGEEVIEILKMLGGKNSTKLVGSASSCGYYIDSDGNIDYHYYSSSYFNDAIQFTLEEFLEKYPYKVGDKVLLSGVVKIIKQARWDDINGEVIYKLETNIRGFSEEYYVHHYDLQPYKKETIEETIIDTIKESADRYRIKVNYQFDIEVDEGEYYVVRRKPQYPKTYEECCKVLNLTKYPPALVPNKVGFITQYEDFPYYYEIQKLAELLVCRNAYWKIAGEQMGLGKPWEPDWSDYENIKYIIGGYDGKIGYDQNHHIHKILAFPTEEMRDAFYENFKDSIEQCKELL